MVKKNQKFRIVIDTNIVNYDRNNALTKIFNNDILDIIKFAKTHKLPIEICVPQMVIDERISERLSMISWKIGSINVDHI